MKYLLSISINHFKLLICFVEADYRFSNLRIEFYFIFYITPDTI